MNDYKPYKQLKQKQKANVVERISAMEAKRLGLCQKSLFVVPNHLTEQWASEFLHLYPNAKLLVARRKDFETANRKKFCARIATGDYDAVIIGHSQFERIPLSFERRERIPTMKFSPAYEKLEYAPEVPTNLINRNNYL